MTDKGRQLIVGLAQLIGAHEKTGPQREPAERKRGIKGRGGVLAATATTSTAPTVLSIGE